MWARMKYLRALNIGNENGSIGRTNIYDRGLNKLKQHHCFSGKSLAAIHLF